MTEKLLYCKLCGVHLAIIRDGKLKKGIVCYCAQCNAIMDMMVKNNDKKVDMPDFLKDIFGQNYY